MQSEVSRNDNESDTGPPRDTLKTPTASELMTISQNGDFDNKSSSSRTESTISCTESTTSSALSLGDTVRNDLIRSKVQTVLDPVKDQYKLKLITNKCKTVKFPVKLMYLLDESSDSENIIFWSADGCSFIIHDPVQFEREVLPKNFKDAKYKSFCRKLYRWGFVKRAVQERSIVYIHEKFQKGDYSLCMDMSCTNKTKSFTSERLREEIDAARASIATHASPPPQVNHVQQGIANDPQLQMEFLRQREAYAQRAQQMMNNYGNPSTNLPHVSMFSNNNQFLPQHSSDTPTRMMYSVAEEIEKYGPMQQQLQQQLQPQLQPQLHQQQQQQRQQFSYSPSPTGLYQQQAYQLPMQLPLPTVAQNPLQMMGSSYSTLNIQSTHGQYDQYAHSQAQAQAQINMQAEQNQHNNNNRNTGGGMYRRGGNY